MGKMFDLLDEALSEAVDYTKGKIKLAEKKVVIPHAPKNYKAQAIKKLRNKLCLSQKNLAVWLNVSLNTVQAWEQGVRNPSQASLRLLEIFDKNFISVKNIYKKHDSHKKNNKHHSGITHKVSTSIAAKSKS